MLLTGYHGSAEYGAQRTVWRAITLSEESIVNNSTSVEIPDFTQGKWKTNQPIFALTKGI